jgi:predicted ATPase
MVDANKKIVRGLLLTDIEGSTRLWEKYPQPMSAALTAHDTLIREAVTQHGGTIYETAGDAFTVILPSVAATVELTVQIQRAFQENPIFKFGGEALRVRTVLHAYEDSPNPEILETALRQAAPLLGAGHGGQVLLTPAVVPGLPTGTGLTLRDYGLRQLRDGFWGEGEKEAVFGLAAPGLPTEFAPLRTLDERQHNLPAPLNSFVGRRDELETLRDMLRLPEVRLVTLLGPGGTGKTRLSIQVARGLIDEFEHGVFFVALESLNTPGLFLNALAQTLGVKETPGTPLLKTVTDFLADRRLLLVLDNFEQVLSATPILNQILQGAPGVKALTSSRTPLEAENEILYEVAPLALPVLEALDEYSLTDLARIDALALFCQRAGFIQHNFRLTAENAPDIARLCVRLDGLPLAIELAAMRIRQFSPAEMHTQLDEGLAMLSEGPVNWTPRQRTLRGAIEWSYNLLPAEEQQLFRRLAAFANNFSLAAARSITLHDNISAALDSLASKSLIRRSEVLILTQETVRHDIIPSCYMLQTIREYALEKLEASGELAEVRQRHADYYAGLTEQAEPHLRAGQQLFWLNLLEEEHNNLRNALNFFSKYPNLANTDTALRMVGSLRYFWDKLCYYSEGRSWLETALEFPLGNRVAYSARALALVGAGALAVRQADLSIARAYFEEALRLYRQADDLNGKVIALNNLAVVTLQLYEFEDASHLLEENLQLARYMRNDRLVSGLTNNLGVALLYSGKYERARHYFEQVRSMKGALGDTSGMAGAAHNLASALLRLERIPEALELYAESLQLSQETGNKAGIAETVEGIAMAHISPEKADMITSVRLFGAMEALREEIGAALTPAEKQFYHPAIEQLKTGLGDIFFESFWEEGRSLKLPDALQLVQEAVYSNNDSANESEVVNQTEPLPTIAK